MPKPMKSEVFSYSSGFSPWQYVHSRKEVAKAVVNISASGMQYDYEQPAKGPDVISWVGSGFCIDGALIGDPGKAYIMTNTHVAEDTHNIQVRLAHDAKTFNAKAVFVGKDVDIAFLEIGESTLKDAGPEAFWEKAKILRFSEEALKVEDDVWAYGFPMGMRELAITKGSTSRMEISLNIVSDLETLTAQWEGATHPGNSGGPVVKADGRVTGVVHQGRNIQGGGEFIPLQIIRHVFEDIKRNGFDGYKGFPGLAIKWGPTKNKTFRDYFKINPQGKASRQGGIHVAKISPMSAAHGILKEDDIILKINNIPIHSDGTFKMEELDGRRINFRHILHESQMGDPIEIELLREGKRYRTSIELKYREGELKLVPLAQSGMRPEFFCYGGLTFQRLTGHSSAILEDIDPILEAAQSAIKERMDQEVIFLHEMIINKYTQGYGPHDFTCKRVVRVDDKDIHNLRDLVEALETEPPTGAHAIYLGKVSSNTKFIMPHLTERERSELLDQYGIPYDRSEKLRTDGNFLGTRRKHSILDSEEEGDSIGLLDTDESDDDDYSQDAQRQDINSSDEEMLAAVEAIEREKDRNFINDDPALEAESRKGLAKLGVRPGRLMEDPDIQGHLGSRVESITAHFSGTQMRTRRGKTRYSSEANEGVNPTKKARRKTQMRIVPE